MGLERDPSNGGRKASMQKRRKYQGGWGTLVVTLKKKHHPTDLSSSGSELITSTDNLMPFMPVVG